MKLDPLKATDAQRSERPFVLEAPKLALDKPLSSAHKALGDAIRDHRERKLKISQEALADKCGLHRTYVSSVERGEANIGYANLLRRADALELKAWEVVKAADRK